MATQKPNNYPVPTKGLYTSAVADSLDNSMTPWCQNVRFRYGQVLKCPGRTIALDTAGARWIMDFAQYTDAAGVKSVLSLEASVATDNTARLYNSSTCKFGTPLALPFASQANTRFSWTAGEERLLVVRSSQLHAINRDTGTGAFTCEQVTGSPAGTFLEYFKNHVMMGNLIGASNRLQWSARAQYNDWQTTQTHGGWLDLYDGTVEPITGMKILGDRLVVYRNSSITDVTATGDDESPFLPEGRVFGIGNAAPWSLTNMGQFHMFLGNDFNVYVWDGVNLNPVGTPVHSYIRQLYDPSALSSWITTPFACAFMGFKEYWLVISQQGSSQYVVLIYDYLRDSWTRDIFANLNALYEQPLPGLAGTPGFNPSGYPTIYPCLMGGMGHDYFMIDERVDGNRYAHPADGGTEMWFDSPDMYYDQTRLVNGTLQRIMVTEGYPVNPSDPPYYIEVSTDRGLTFPYSVQVNPIQAHLGYEFTDHNITSNVRRYRFHYKATDGAAGNPSWRSYTDDFVPSGEFFPGNPQVGASPAGLPPTGVEQRQAGLSLDPDVTVPPDL